jgi:hypothetical protein
MEGYCSTGQSPQRAVVPMEKKKKKKKKKKKEEEEEEEEEEEKEKKKKIYVNSCKVPVLFRFQPYLNFQNRLLESPQT